MTPLFKRSLYVLIGIALALFLALGRATVALVPPTAAPQVVSGESGDPRASALLDTGRAAYQNQQVEEAIVAWQAAAAQFAQQGQALPQALALSYLAMAYQSQGGQPQAERAIAHSRQLLEQWQQVGDDGSEPALLIQGQVFNTQGSVYFSQGALTAALESWQQAGTFYQQAEDSQRYIGSLINQARTLQSLGYFLQARETLDTVYDELNGAEPSLQVLGRHSLGDTLQVIGDLDRARAVYTEGLEIAAAQSLFREQSALLLSLGHLVQRQQQPMAALEFYRRAAAIAPDVLQRVQAQVDEVGVLAQSETWAEAQRLTTALLPQLQALPPSRASLYAQTHLAYHLMHAQQGADKQAAELLGTTLQQAQALGDRYAETYAMGYLGNAYEMTQQWSHAQNLTEAALLIAQTLNATDIAYQWQWQLGRILKAQNQSDRAILAYQGAFQSLQSLRYDLAAITPDQQFSFRKSVEPVYRDYVDLLLGPDAVPERLQQARQVIESLQIAELNNFFQSTCIEGQAIALDQVDQAGAAILYPIILRDRLEVVVSLPDQPLQHHGIPVTREQVNGTLDQLRLNLTRPFVTADGRRLGEEVYSWLIRPIEADLQQKAVQTLVFVLDGSLRSVPMAALYTGDHYLIEDYSVALAPGLQLIAPRSLQQQGFETLAGGLTEARYGFSALPNVGPELEKIEATVPSRVLIDESFTSEALRGQVEALPYPVVHLATHGQFSSRAEETFILAWDRPLDVNEISAILRTGDQTRQTPIELLILSACETAAGDDRAALGLAGIAVRAGARSTMATLWSLDDRAGAIMVGKLYDALIEPDNSKADALRQAQLAMLSDSNYRAPYYWSAFVLVGSWI